MKRKSMITLLTLLSVIVAPSLLFPADVSISVSPIRVEHHTMQGEEGTDTIYVTNDGVSATRMNVSVEYWDLTRDGNPVFMKEDGDPYSCVKWVRVNPNDFRIDPGQTIDVRYTVKVPEGTEDGGFRAAIVLETVPDVTIGERSRGVYLKGRIATILYEMVGKPVSEGYANNLDADLRKDGMDFTLSLQNRGKAHFRTKGSIKINSSDGSNTFEIELPDVPVLPESERDIKVAYNKVVPKGKYMATAVIDIGNSDLIGAETAFEVE